MTSEDLLPCDSTTSEERIDLEHAAEVPGNLDFAQARILKGDMHVESRSPSFSQET